MNIKKLLGRTFLLPFLIILMVFFPLIPVQASTSFSSTGINYSVYHDVLNGLKSTGVMNHYVISGRDAFCIESGRTIRDTNGVESFVSGSTNNMTTSAVREVTADDSTQSKIAYIGYYSLSKPSTKDYAFTQMYIWQSLPESNVTANGFDSSKNSYRSYFTDKELSSEYAAWKSKVSAKVNSWNKTPSFHNKSIDIKAGESLTLTDSNSALQDYNAFSYSKDGISISHKANSNELSVSCSASARLDSVNMTNANLAQAGAQKYSAKYSANYIYAADNSQNMCVYGSTDPVGLALRFSVSTFGDAEISKKSITGEDEIPGAHLQVLSSDGSVYDEWDSAAEAHVIRNMPCGKYVLRETLSPVGFLVANDLEFEIKPAETTKLTMRDDFTKLEISKSSITDEEELPGATLQILDAEGNVYEEWVSGEAPHLIERIPAGAYTLREITAPEGFVTANDVDFTVELTGEVQKVVMKDDFTKLKISKQDITGSIELEGAHLQIINSQGEVIEEWDSLPAPHYTEYIPVGKYILRETLAPDGYMIANDVEFEVSDTGEVQSVIMYDELIPEIPDIPTSPKTGDTVNIISLLIVMGTALFTLGLVLCLRRKS